MSSPSSTASDGSSSRIDGSDRGIDGPDQRTDGSSPRIDDASRHRDGSSPQRDGSSPQRDGSSPQRDGSSPEADDSSPRADRSGRNAGAAPRDAVERPVTVIVPTYNEAECIEATIDRCRAALAAYPSEVLVVDDDSPDRTWQLVRTVYGNDDDVRVIRRVDESGLASAVVRGFREAANPFCVVMDGDLQHPPERVPDLLAAFDDDVDIVVGSRYADGGGIENWSRRRRAVSAGARAIAKLLVPAARGLSDPMSGFFAMRRRVVGNVELSPTGYKILLEVLVNGDYHGVREVPYEFTERHRGDSKLTAAEYRNFLRHVVALRFG